MREVNLEEHTLVWDSENRRATVEWGDEEAHNTGEDGVCER